MSGLLALDLWSPHHGLSLGTVIVTAFLLGVVHGVTPDEHTWPITFSYALGSFSTRKGMRSALAFSLAFTVQRALLSELAYLGLLHVANNATWNAAIYLVVGAVMALAAFYVLRLHCALHLHLWPPSVGRCHRPQHADTAEWAARTPTPAMAAVHGFVAGWGLGAFALIMATVLAPAMPSAALGWVPGAAFGLGTTAVLAGAGAVIGSLIRHQRLPEHLAQRVAQEGAGWTLLVGGALFVVAGAAGLLAPSIMTAGISTGIHVHNLDQLGIGTLLVALVMIVAAITIARTVHHLRHIAPEEQTHLRAPTKAVGAGTAPPSQCPEVAEGMSVSSDPKGRGPGAQSAPGRAGDVPGAPNVAEEPDFAALEAEVAEFWARHRVFERSITEREGCPEFVFFEGPPTANGRPGLHHVWARVYKDLFCRFHTMRGKRVARRAGWDTHGLAVEVEVERELGLSSKRDIEAFGVGEFVERCRSSVRRYVEEWERLTERIGFWLDAEDAYRTLDASYVESVWWHLHRLWEKGLLYEDMKVVPYCPRCETALSSHELAQPGVWREVADTSAYVRLFVEGPAPPGVKSLLIWTTTPWTLVSNTAVAVDPERSYVVVDGAVVAEARGEAVLGPGATRRATSRVRGSELVGVRYRRPLEMVAVPEGSEGKGWRVVGAGFVSAEEGTGLVHIAPAFGADDWQLGRQEDLAVLNPVGTDGRFTEAAGPLSGKPVRDAVPEVLAALERAGQLVRAEPYPHAYPHCWRCGTPLLYRGTPSWYVATASNKEALIAANETIAWRPEHVQHGRFGEWLEANVDWALSRDRYWGTPLPIWRCPAGHTTVVASLAELSELAGRDLSRLDPHRPLIDEVHIACPDCRGDARRVEAVLDAWFDSGAMPAAQWGYPHLAGSAEQLRLPADFVCEAIDQTRGWFYSLLAVNTLVFGTAPYRHALALGHIVDADGRKMSKSLGNAVDPWAILDRRGVDPLRWWMFHQGSPWTSTRASIAAIDASTAEVLMTLWHTWRFYSTYAHRSHPDPAPPPASPPERRRSLDRWARARLHATVTAVTGALEDYQPLPAATALGALVDDLSNWYLRRSRHTIRHTGSSGERADALATLREALVTVSLLLAPFCPFLAEAMWRELTGAAEGASVHLAPWPTADRSAADPALEAEMAQARRLVSLGRAARAEAGIKVRQPLRRALVVLAPDAPVLLADVIAEELNVDEVVRTDTLSEMASVELAPNFRLLGPRLGKAVTEVRERLGRLDPLSAAETLERGEPIDVELASGRLRLGPDEVVVRVRGKEGFALGRQGTEALALDVALDDDLRRRGRLREVVHQLQERRRALGLEVGDPVRVHLEGLDELAGSADDIAREVCAVDVAFCEGPGEGYRLGLEGPGARAWILPVDHTGR